MVLKDIVFCRAGVDLDYRQLGVAVRTEQLLPIVQSFIENLDNVGKLLAVPRDLGYFMYKLGEIEMSSTIKVLGNLEFTADEAHSQNVAITEQSKAEYRRFLREQIANNSQDMSNLSWTYSGQKLDQLLDWGVQLDGEQLLNKSVLLWLWTAFESFTEDLWIAAVNNGPKRVIKKVVKGFNLHDGKKRKVLSFSTLQEFQFDIRHRLGDVLVKEGIVNFDSRDGIVLAYSAALGTSKVEELTNLVCYQYTIALEQIRHLLAHKAGLIDSRFVSKMPRLKGYPPAFTEGEKLKIDRGIVVMNWNSVVAFATSLLHAVDAEISDS